MNSVLTPSLISVAVSVAIVLRFAQRELRLRTVHLRTLWIRPAVLLAIAGYLIYLSVALESHADRFLAGAVAAGAVLGLGTGLAVLRNTRIEPAGDGAARVQGNRWTLLIWIGAVAVRLLARFALPHGADPRAQLPLDAGLVALTAVAFTVIALAFARAARQPGATGAVTLP